VREIRLQTDRKTQLVDITGRVREALGESAEGSAVLVYVPHTTAAVTINEHLDPALLVDIEEALARIVDDGWDWRHDDVDGPNAPSHMRASLLAPQVLVPLDDGRLALGTYQGIFFCELDGPRERRVFVAPLA
jgi:secondary thiamine-phosphate synthase enzyme